MHGMENAVDDDDDDEIEQQLNSMMKGKRRIVEGHTFGGTNSSSGVAGDKLEKVFYRSIFFCFCVWMFSVKKCFFPFRVLSSLTKLYSQVFSF